MVLLLLTSFNVFPFPQKQLKLHTVTKAHLSLSITEDKTTERLGTGKTSSVSV